MNQSPIILFNPQSSASKKPVLPMALLAVGALLEGEFEYHIVDGNLCTDALSELDRSIRETGSTILAVTVMGGPQLRYAVEACRALKSKYRDLIVVWGGYFPTQHADVCLRSDFVDYVVAGHGEEVFLQLLRSLKKGEGPCRLPGVAWVGGRTTAPIPDLNDLPDFPYSKVPVERYVRRTFMGERTLPHHSSYGCPFRCNFCAVVNMVEGRWRAQSAERTARTVATLIERWRIDAVEFYDNNFFVSEKRVAEFADRIRSFGVRWWGEARVDTLLKYDAGVWRLMRDSGLTMVFLGAESGSDETLRRMNKGGTASADRTLEIADVMRRYGIVPEFSFVLGNPPDPENDIEQTISFVRRLKSIHPDAETVLYMYTPVPLAGDLYEGAQASGFRFPETLDEWIGPGWQEFAQRRSARVPWMVDPLRRRVRNFERVLHAYYPTVTDPSLRGLKRKLLRAAGAWRYHLELYGIPIELLAMQKLFAFQRPETTGF